MESVKVQSTSPDYIRQMLESIKDCMEQVRDEVFAMGEMLEYSSANTSREETT